MRKKLYDSRISDTFSVKLPLKADYDNNLKITLPPPEHMAWIEEHNLADDDWRIEANSEGPHVVFVFRDPSMLVLFKLAFK